MPDKYQNKYRIPSARLKGWDYARSGSYFITICTQHREHFFGEILEGKMLLSPIGEIAFHEWMKTAAIRPDMNLILGAFVVMPNHVHGIIIIGDNEYNGVETPCMASLRSDQKNQFTQFGPQYKNVASIIRGYKSSVTTHARKMGDGPFNWQPLYHDHIIRNQEEYERIAAYIENNPFNWKEDKFYIE